MNKHLKVSLALIGAAGMIHADDNRAFTTGRSFFWVRPPFQSAMPEKETMFRDRALARECGWSGAWQAVGFGGQSTHEKDMAQYFMFCGKDELIAAESGISGLDTNPYLRDVNAAYFNIHTTGNNFQSTFKFRPKQSYWGVGLEYKQYLHRKNACDKYWWIDFSFPIEKVNNTMDLTETTPTYTGQFLVGSNVSMTEAFKGLKPLINCSNYTGTACDPTSAAAQCITGSGWQYGKINGSRDYLGVADLEIKIGYDFICGDCAHAEAYLGVLVPTGNREKAHYLFEPIVGHGQHVGPMWGATWGWQVWENCDSCLQIEMHANGRYLFEAKETRSFDVKGKPWSRYMSVYRNYDDMAAGSVYEGINVFTREMNVTPRYLANLNSALLYAWCNWRAEIGYNFWARTSDKIELASPWVDGQVGFACLYNDTAPAGGIDCPLNDINRASTIRENFSGFEGGCCAGATADTYADLAIHTRDLDLLSAQVPAAITNIFYGSLGYRRDDWCWPAFASVGGSYELSSEHGALSRWMVWGKVGLSL